MVNRKGSWLAGVLLAIVMVTPTQARGRRPADDDDDKFPDYNRIEMRPKPKTTEAPASAPDTKPEPPKPPPSLNTPLNPALDEESAPKPPPEVVPLPTGASEPPLPDEIMDTLGAPTTAQK